eukprot:CAMPEP_0113512356 /NCGR_PEP_ID=MMETSP0014_2-20120614/39298_1 /TAXON_ID=2857 /ORGANISM="Nitzschia sp." /LENGTH=197 /DNA_ID=CAMNT_0000408713 /DNA_START=476 /DNA_END=1069 /DNA_ORIENTATION=+ /assembly_acc=CAM_ASM_000159
MAMMKFEKKILYKGMGQDQLGNYIGTPEPGDVVKIHVRGFYVVRRPLFKLGNFVVKRRKVEFLDTHMIGDTAFVELTIDDGEEPNNDDGEEPNNDEGAKHSSNNIVVEMLTLAVKGMMLGESAKVMFGDNALAGKRHLLPEAQDAAGRAFFKSIPGDDEEEEDSVQSIEFDIDCFRIVRRKKEHHRPARTGPGGWAM